jgi:hypothetical protein
VREFCSCIDFIDAIGNVSYTRYELYTVASCLLPFYLMLHIAHTLLSGIKDLKVFRITFVLAIYIAFLWISLVLIKIFIGIRHNARRRSFLAEM